MISTKKIVTACFIFALFKFSPCFSSDNSQSDDHPVRWTYEGMNAWDQKKQIPSTFDRTGKGVGIALIEGPNFNLQHPVFARTNISLIDLGGDNLATHDHNRTSQYHANHVAAIIAGHLDEPYSDMDLDFLCTLRKDNPKFFAESPSQGVHLKYYGGLSPDAKIYAYPRKLETSEQDLGTLLKIFEDIETKEDIRLINLSFRLSVNPSIIAQMNRLAEKGILFVQATGNDGLNLDDSNHKEGEAIHYFEGSRDGDFSLTFWNRHIFVGALNCYKSSLNKVEMERWQGSSYYVKRDTLHAKNFIMAPGSCIFSASKMGYDLRSGTSMATGFVTGALACALEKPRAIYRPETLVDHLLSFSKRTDFGTGQEVSVPFLDVKGLIDADDQHEKEAILSSLPEKHSLLELYQGDHPTRWFYEAMGAWDTFHHAPCTKGYTGTNIGIALIGSPYFNLDHPTLKNSSIEIVRTLVSFVKYSDENPKYRAVPVYLGFEPSLKEPVRLPLKALIPHEPTKTTYTYKGENLIPLKDQENKYWHSNHTLSLMVGRPEKPYLEEVCPYSLLPWIREHNPKLQEISYPGYSMRDIAYYGGMAPNSKVYAYPRDVSGSTTILSAILNDIQAKDDVRLINLNCKIEVDLPTIQKMNLLAEKGKIFIQGAGNNGQNLDLEENSKARSIQCIGNASFADFSSTFWDHYIPVGALACYKTTQGLPGLDIWKDSSYSLSQNPQFKNFIFAPGACIVSASYNGFCCDSNTRIAASFVTSALACALESRGGKQNFNDYAMDFLKEKHSFSLASGKNTTFSILNIKNIL